MKTPGEILKLMREVAGLSQSELEKLAGMPPGRVSHLETGHRGIGYKSRNQLAKAFNLTVEDFMRVITESRGDKRCIEIWLRIHNLREIDGDVVIRRIIDILELTDMANNHHISRELVDNLLAQIENFHNLAKKMIPPSEA